jgi:glycosyltransferase involved in cell wall biosynthesis
VAATHPRARWLRRVGDGEYLRLLQQSDLLVLPLRQSTTCTAVLESLACGLPVVTDKGGIEDYLAPDCSVALSVGDAGGM